MQLTDIFAIRLPITHDTAERHSKAVYVSRIGFDVGTSLTAMARRKESGVADFLAAASASGIETNAKILVETFGLANDSSDAAELAACDPVEKWKRGEAVDDPEECERIASLTS